MNLKHVLLATAICAVALSSNANAWVVTQDGGTGNAASLTGPAAAAAARATSSVNSRVTSSNRNTNTNRNLNTATGGTGGASYATGGSGGAGGVSTVTVNGAGSGGGSGDGYNGPGVASAIAPPVYTANPCSGSPITAGLTTSVVGLSFGAGNGFDGACRIEQAAHNPIAMQYLCEESSETRAAIKKMALQGLAQPCYDDITEVAQKRAAATPTPPTPATPQFRADAAAWCHDPRIDPSLYGQCVNR